MDENLLYITSPSYSGSTLLTILLAQHPRVATIGELKASAFGDTAAYPCSCGMLLAQCPYWQSLTEQILVRDPAFDLHHWRTHFRAASGHGNRLLSTGHRGPLFETLRDAIVALWPPLSDQKRSIIDNNRHVIDAVLRQSGASTFVDGSKDPIRARYLYDSGHWPMSVVTLIRDGRGFTNSFMRHEQADMRTAVAEWMAKVAEIEHLQRHVGRRSLVVRYEELCAQPLAVVNRILEFAGLTPLSALPFPLAPGDRHIFGNAMRLKTITEVRADEKWRTELSPGDLTIFHELAGVANQRFGYQAT